jgi:hypothetical protein
MTYTKICTWCGKEYETDEVEADLCSLACLDAEMLQHNKDVEAMYDLEHNYFKGL